MKRRKLMRYGLLAGATLGSGLWQRSRSVASPSQPRDRPYDWIFLYWMPYDNNLSRFGTPILEMIAQGIHSDNILVAVQADFLQTPQLSRTIFTQDTVETQELLAENSADVAVFSEYLNWAQSRFRAKYWAIIFLGHGGCLDEVSPDVRVREDGSEMQWLNIQDIGNAISEFNQKIGNRVELFFFQNCNKGTLEAHYTLHKIANYTLSSQRILGAPNYYYESLFRFLGHTSATDGLQLAEKIVEFERSDMYSSYTVVNNRTVSDLFISLDRLINSILSGDLDEINLEVIPKYRYANENSADLVEFFRILTQQSGADFVEYQNFIDAANNAIAYFPNLAMLEVPAQKRKIQNSSGLGLFLPENCQQLKKYEYLSVYENLKLLKLFHAIL